MCRDEFQPVLDRIEERVHIRRENWHTEETPVLPPFEWMDETCIVSKHTRIDLETKRRYLLDTVLISVNGTKETPGAVARDYLKCKYKHGPKWTASQREKIREELVDSPVYVAPCIFDEGYYIDIRACFWSVMVRCGWQVCYFPGEYLLIDTPPLDFPFAENKRARNCLVTVGRSSQLQLWTPDKGTFEQHKPNYLANTQLYCLIMDCLHGIANEVVAAGAVYVATDGYIAPNYKTMLKVCEIVKSWGFIPLIKGEGEGFVNNLGSYKVGRLYIKHPTNTVSNHGNLKQVRYHKWLRKRMGLSLVEAQWHDTFITRPRSIGYEQHT